MLDANLQSQYKPETLDGIVSILKRNNGKTLAKMIEQDGVDFDVHALSALDQSKFKAAEIANRMGDPRDKADIYKQALSSMNEPIIKKARSIISSEYVESIADKGALDNAPDLNVKSIAIQTTLRKIDTWVDAEVVSELNEEQYKSFLFRSHQLLTGQVDGKKGTKANLTRILREVSNDPYLPLEDAASARAKTLIQNDIDEFAIIVGPQLLSATVKNNGVYFDEMTQETAKFILTYMPEFAKDMREKKVGNRIDTMSLEMAPLVTRADKKLLEVAHYAMHDDTEFQEQIHFAEAVKTKYKIEEYKAIRTPVAANKPQKPSMLTRVKLGVSGLSIKAKAIAATVAAAIALAIIPVGENQQSQPELEKSGLQDIQTLVGVFNKKAPSNVPTPVAMTKSPSMVAPALDESVFPTSSKTSSVDAMTTAPVMGYVSASFSEVMDVKAQAQDPDPREEMYKVGWPTPRM